jgi:hypothetical protein
MTVVSSYEDRRKTARALYEQYGKPLEAEHKGESVVISDSGKTIVGKSLTEVVTNAIEKFGKGQPNNISDKAKAADTVKRLLSNLATITQGIAELRNHYGTGHGKAAGAKGLGPRHAKLAVGAASTLAVFLAETHNEKPRK